MLDHYNLDKSEVEQNFAKWREATGESNSIDNKIKSMVDSLGDQGAVLKREASDNPILVKNLNKRVKDIEKIVENASKSNFKVSTFADDLNNAYKQVAEKYGEVKKSLQSVPVKAEFETEPWEALDEATKGSVSELKLLIGEDNPYINSKDLIDAMPIINSLIRKTKGKTMHQWSEVANAVDTQLKDVLTTSQYKLWKETNKLYSKMANVRESKLGDLIATATNKSYKGTAKKTPEEVMDKLVKISGGDDVFTDLTSLVPKEKVANLEKAIINRALKDDKSWNTIANNLNKKGFVTEPGKNLTKLVNNFKTVFKTDDAMRTLNTKIGQNGASIATTAEGKAAVWVINKLANMVRKHIPYSATAKHLRKLDTLFDVLKTPTKVEELSKAFSELPQSVRDDIGTDYINKLQEFTEYENQVKNLGKEYMREDDTKFRVNYAEDEVIPRTADIKIAKDKILFDNQKLKEGSGQGGRSYEDLFKLSEKLSKPIQPDGGLIDKATYRFPIAIAKYLDKTGKMPKVLKADGSPYTKKALDTAILDIKASLNRGEKLNISEDTIKLLDKIIEEAK
jgi:hypothetical protein